MYSSSSESRKSDSTEESQNQLYFLYPQKEIPQLPQRLCQSANPQSSSNSDTSLSDGQIEKQKRRSKKKVPKSLPPIGVFWDIENCQVPKNKSAASVVQRIRETLFTGYREVEFIVVCDVKKESAQVIQDLHDAQVNLIHVQSTSKNAADEKLRQSLRRFGDTYPAPSAVVLISGDVNFAADLSDLRYRKKIHVILVHNVNVADALILCANERHNFTALTQSLPVLKPKSNPSSKPVDLIIFNLPVSYDRNKVKQRLKYLSDNCGGKVINYDCEKGTAVIRFTTVDYANRAQKRLRGEDVYGFKVKVLSNIPAREPQCRNYQGRKIKNSEVYQLPLSSHNLPGYGSDQSFQRQSQYSRDSWRYREQDSNIPDDSFRTIRSTDNFEMAHDGLWSSQHSFFGEHRMNSPQSDMNGACALSVSQYSQQFNTPPSSYDDRKCFYVNGSSSNKSSTTSNSPVDLVINNIDSSIEIKDIKNILINLLEKFVVVLSLNVSTQVDGSPVANLKVPSREAAQFAISQLHHYKLGYKRLTISYAQNNTIDPSQLRDMVVSLLQEVPGNRMPLFKLLDLLEYRFHTNVSMSEVTKLKDVCKISDEGSERIISLSADVRYSPNTFGKVSSLYCIVHCPLGLENTGWGEPALSQLPNVNMSLQSFSLKLEELLMEHMGTLPLLSLPICYESVFNEPLATDEAGVPLEHLVTCVNNVQLKFVGPTKCVKYVTEPKKEDESVVNVSPHMVSNINLLCREIVDLLKTMERCQLPLSRFIPAYHHHFGRQCRVADYGFTKLIDLLESDMVASVVQILGDGTRKKITLTHSAQIRRFTSDLLKILKGQSFKQLSICDFPGAYERIMSKPFSAVEYGLCTLEDLLEKVPENLVVITKLTKTVIISIPKREQTAEEMMRTKQFADEVVRLLRYSPHCSMLFNKFVPAYHHHFSHQCKVSDYGFTKLIELFEAIPDTVKIEELPDGERQVSLTLPKALQVLGSQISYLIRKSELSSLSLYSLNAAYLREYGYALKPSVYDCSDITELVSKLSEFIQVTYSSIGPLLVLVDSESVTTMTIRVWSLLLKPPHRMDISEFIAHYHIVFQGNITVAKLENLQNVCKMQGGVSSTFIILTPFYILVAQIYDIIYNSGGQVNFNQLEKKYRQKFGKRLCPSDYNFSTLEELLSEMGFLIVIKGSRNRIRLCLNKKLTEFGVPFKSDEDTTNYELPSSIGNSRKVSPPKPDSPPSPLSSPWALWSTPSKSRNEDLSIQLPQMQAPKLMENAEDLISPTKSLLPPTNYQMGSILPVINAPDPSELPMPDKLLGKAVVCDDSGDSGVINNSHINSENEMDMSSENGAKGKQLICNKGFFSVNM